MDPMTLVQYAAATEAVINLMANVFLVIYLIGLVFGVALVIAEEEEGEKIAGKAFIGLVVWLVIKFWFASAAAKTIIAAGTVCAATGGGG